MIVLISSFVGLFSLVLIQTNCKKKKKEVEPQIVNNVVTPPAQSIGSKSTYSNDNIPMDMTQREDETELVLEELELEEQQKQMKKENKTDNNSGKSKKKSAEKSGKKEKSEKDDKQKEFEIDKTQAMSEKEEPEQMIEITQNSMRKSEKKNRKNHVPSLKFYGESPQKKMVKADEKGSQEIV